MRIDENIVFLFNFDAQEMGGGCSFPIRATSREEAVRILQGCLNRFQTELAMEFPKVSIAATLPGVPSAIPPEVLQTRIETLMTGMGATLVTKDAPGLTPEAFSETILNWTGKEYSPQNYALIVRELELIASGQKEIPPPKKKKA